MGTDEPGEENNKWFYLIAGYRFLFVIREVKSSQVSAQVRSFNLLEQVVPGKTITRRNIRYITFEKYSSFNKKSMVNQKYTS